MSRQDNELEYYCICGASISKQDCGLCSDCWSELFREEVNQQPNYPSNVIPFHNPKLPF